MTAPTSYLDDLWLDEEQRSFAELKQQILDASSLLSRAEQAYPKLHAQLDKLDSQSRQTLQAFSNLAQQEREDFSTQVRAGQAHLQHALQELIDNLKASGSAEALLDKTTQLYTDVQTLFVAQDDLAERMTLAEDRQLNLNGEVVSTQQSQERLEGSVEILAVLWGYSRTAE